MLLNINELILGRFHPLLVHLPIGIYFIFILLYVYNTCLLYTSRDWVIKAFNENMTYDQFVTWQLAGDLIPNATKDQRLATAFNRIHAQNVEGGIVNEEFRVEYVMDRTNTFGTAFLGLTVECARCHDHKFDPFSQKDYYQLYSYFNNIEEAGQIPWDDATPVPTMLLSTASQDSILAFIDKSIENKSNEIALSLIHI